MLLALGARGDWIPASRSDAAAPQATSDKRSAPDGPVEAELRNVDFHIHPGGVLQIRQLRGELVPTEKGVPPTFDNRNSFTVKIDSALIGITPANLADLLNGYVFAYRGVPLRNLKVTINGSGLLLEGTLVKSVGIPFESEGQLSATADGLIRLHLSKIKSAHLPVKGLMDLLGIKMASLINLSQSRGARVEGDDIILDPERIVPPPHVQGKVTSVETVGEEIVLYFGPQGEKSSPKPLSPPRPHAPNYMYFRGGTLRFGKLTMTDADLEIIDLNPDDNFDFDLSEYNRQLVAGYSKTTPAYGLIVFMPDLSRLGQSHNDGANKPSSQ